MRAWIAVLLISVLAGACGEPAEVVAGASDGPSIRLAGSDLGEILVDGDGGTLYLLTGDEQGASTCYEGCEENWPPLSGPVQAADGVDESLLGETERNDGTTQATYNEWPLYYYAGDAQAGDVNGQGVGDVWFVLDAAGEPIKKAGGVDRPRDY